MIVSTETGGLGNRIKSWVSAMRLEPDARVHWAINANMPAGFSQLFANACSVDPVPSGARTHKSWRLIILPEDEAHLPAGFSTVGASTHPLVRGIGKATWILRGRPSDRYRYMVFPKSHSKQSARADARHIDLEYERIPEYFRELYSPLFQRIAVREEIVRCVNEWSNAHLDENVIGVQVRTWRDDPRRHKKYHRPSVRRLFRLMDGVGAEDRFLIVSDSDDTAEALKSRYGDSRVLCFPRTTHRQASWTSPEGMIEDLVDMLLLSRTGRLFASYLSTFSETAWWLGGARARVWVF